MSPCAVIETIQLLVFDDLQPIKSTKTSRQGWGERNGNGCVVGLYGGTGRESTPLPQTQRNNNEQQRYRKITTRRDSFRDYSIVGMKSFECVVVELRSVETSGQGIPSASAITTLNE